MFKKILYTLLIIFVLVIGAAIAIPYFFKDEIIQVVKETANENCNCTVEFSDVNLSIFKSFPFLNVEITDFDLDGVADFDKMDLFDSKAISVDLNVMDVINNKKPLVIRGISLIAPNINILVQPDGKANYDVAKAKENNDNSTSEALDFNIESINIENANISYVDLLGNMKAVVKNANLKGNVSSAGALLSLNQDFSSESIYVKSGGVTYLNNIKTSSSGDILIDSENSNYSVKDLSLKLNELNLKSNAKIKMSEKDIDIDFVLNSGKVGLRELYSIIPLVYTKDFSSYKFDGNGSIALTALGKYAFNGSEMPVVDFKMDINNGQFSYPELAYPIKDINTNISVKSLDKKGDRWKVQLPDLSLNVNNEKVSGNFLYDGVGTNGRIKGAFDSKIHLENFDPTMSGLIDADVKFDGRIEDVLNKNYKHFDASGDIVLQDVNMKYDNKDVKIASLDMKLSPENLSLDNLNAVVGKSDFKGNIAINDPLAMVLDEGKSQVEYNISGKTLNVDEWMGESSTDVDTASQSSPIVLPFSNVKGSVKFDNLVYDGQFFQDFKLSETMKGENLNLKDFSLNNKDIDVRMKGEFSNLISYLNNTGELKGNVDLKSRRLYLNDYIGGETSTESTPVSNQILLPENMDLKVTTKIDHVIYGEYDVKKIDTDLTIKDEKMSFRNMEMILYDSPMKVTGFYNAKDHKKPVYDIDYKLKKLKYKKAFEAMGMMQKYMPLLEKVDGNMNFALKASGSMGEDGLPNLNDISASGFIHTLTAVLDDLKIWDKVSAKLGLKSLDELKLKDTKNWFEIKDGNFAIKPFDFEYEDLKFNVAGKHSLNSVMDYTIKIIIPSEKLNQNEITQNLQNEANKLLKYTEKLGLKKTQIDSYEWQINVGGAMTKPDLKYKFLGVNGKESVGDVVKDQIDSVVETVKDSVKTRIEEEKEKAKELIEEKKEEVIDSAKIVIKEKVNEVVDTLKDKVTEEAKKVLKDQADDLLKDVLKDEKVDKTVDDALDKLKDWNPFGN